MRFSAQYRIHSPKAQLRRRASAVPNLIAIKVTARTTLIQSMYQIQDFLKPRNNSQGRKGVCFFVVDPIFVTKFLILDSKTLTNFGP